MTPDNLTLHPIGIVHSVLTRRDQAPKQGYEGAPEAWVEILPAFIEGIEGLATGDEIILITWFHQAQRVYLRVHPRGDRTRPLTGVFATRSPDRPNPIGLHRVTVREISGNKLKVHPLEAIEGTPVVDIKPVLPASTDA
jgi:tRNA-Thr(GGU) m(6)t(6)A37 methyltransferase TsaA